jgi:single-strand DNA-binding protein
MNRVFLVGKLGNDAELKVTQSGKGIINMSLATTKTWWDRSTGEKRSVTQWHRLIWWNDRHENILPYLVKGATVCIEGELENRSWTDQAGAKRSVTEVNVKDLELIGEQRSYGGAQGHQGQQERTGYHNQGQPAQQRAPQQQELGAQPDPWGLGNQAGGRAPDDDIPF